MNHIRYFSNRCFVVFILVGLVAALVYPSMSLAQTAQPTKETPVRRPSLDGYCTVSYLVENKALKGDAANQSEYLGELYYFANKQAKEAFDANPNKHLPELGGLCAMALGGPYGNRLAGDPTVFMVIDGRIFLFSSERAKRAYLERPTGVIENALKVFDQPKLSGFCPVSYIRDNRAVKGVSDIRVVYDMSVYHFVDEAARKAFAKEPARYLPQFGSYCAASIIDRKKYYADANFFSVVDGKTYLFMNEQKKQWFDAHPGPTIIKGKMAWAKIKGAE